MSSHATPHPPGRNAIRLRERDAGTSEPPPPSRPRISRAPLIAGAVLVAVLALAAVAGYLYDHGRRDLIARGVRVGGVDVGGLREDAARTRLEHSLVGRLRSTPVTVIAAGRTFHLTPQTSRVRVAVDQLAAEAVRRSRQGSIFTRVVRGLDGAPLHVDIPASALFSHAAVSHLVGRIALRVAEPARDASVRPTATSLVPVPARDGVFVDQKLLGRRIEQALVNPSGPHTVVAPLHRLRPAVTQADLAHRYPAYIIIDRRAFRLRFFERLHLSHTYVIAVGRQGLETPAGLYDIQWKEVNPSWHVPNSSWAGSLAGRVIPPGPSDPIKARWMAFNGGAGIHGTDETSSLGTAASHGCIRMAVPDVIALYPHVPVGTPVYVV